MNPPNKSKINFTQLIMFAVGAVSAAGVIPAEAVQPLAEVTLMGGAALTAIFRTWFTGNK